MTDIGIEVVGARTVALKFNEFPDKARRRLLVAIQQLTEELYAAVVSAEPVRTGALRRATAMQVYDNPDSIVGRVAVTQPSFGKAAALEYGAHGTAKVSAHMMKLDHVFSRAVSPLQVMVERYTRRVNIAEHRFLRGPAEAIRPEALAEIRLAVQQAEAE